MNIRNRIKEFRTVQPGEIAPNVRNWRTHPQAQRDALRGVLADIGIAGALLAYHSARNGGQLTLIDGHERSTVETAWPCLILDVTDEEADKLLATFDPISAMAGTDRAKLEDLLSDISTDSPALAQMLTDLAESAGIVPELAPTPTPPAAPAEDRYKEQYGVIVLCADEQQQQQVYEMLKADGYTVKVVTT